MIKLNIRFSIFIRQYNPMIIAFAGYVAVITDNFFTGTQRYIRQTEQQTPDIFVMQQECLLRHSFTHHYEEEDILES